MVCLNYLVVRERCLKNNKSYRKIQIIGIYNNHFQVAMVVVVVQNFSCCLEEVAEFQSLVLVAALEHLDNMDKEEEEVEEEEGDYLDIEGKDIQVQNSVLHDY
jgi:hypothetical protein